MHDVSIGLADHLRHAELETFVDREGDLGYRRRSAVVMVSHQGAGHLQLLKLRALLVGWQTVPSGALDALNVINTQIAFGTMTQSSAPGFPAVAYDYAMVMDSEQPPWEAMRWTCAEFAATGDRYERELVDATGGMPIGELMLTGGGFEPWP